VSRPQAAHFTQLGPIVALFISGFKTTAENSQGRCRHNVAW